MISKNGVINIFTVHLQKNCMMYLYHIKKLLILIIYLFVLLHVNYYPYVTIHPASASNCTYKITENELPVLVFGTSNFNRHFCPLGLCLLSTDKAADTFKTLFRILKSCGPLIMQQLYDITHVMADGVPDITSAMCVNYQKHVHLCVEHT